MKLKGVLLALVEEGSFDCDPTNGVGSSLSMILGGGKLRGGSSYEYWPKIRLGKSGRTSG